MRSSWARRASPPATTRTSSRRKGIGLGGAGEAWYVADKDIAANTLTVVQGHNHPLLMKSSLKAQDASWVAGDAPAAGATHSARTRYRQPDSACIVTRAEDGEI